MNKKVNIYISIVIGFILLFVIVLNSFSNKDKKVDNTLYEASFNYKTKDEEGMTLYNQYHPEDGLLFDFVGSDMYDYYGEFYKGTVEKLSDFIKHVIFIKNADYGSWEYDMDRMCYKLSLNDYKALYQEFYGNDYTDISVDDGLKDKIIIDDSICISDNIQKSYTKTIDTYLVNIARLDNKIIIYERVAFVKIGDKKIEFYKDYSMEEKVYQLDKDKVDISFINESSVVSNVLLEYQDEFPLYQYTYVKGEDTYYLESISK